MKPASEVMKFVLAIFLIAITSFANSSHDKTQKAANSQEPRAAQTEVENELKRVAALFRAGDFIEAQRHAEKAVSLDPSNLKALTFLARVQHQRYKPGVQTLENIEQARASIATYERLLALDWENEEAYKAVAALYAAIHEDQLLERWILQRASNPQFPTEKRAEGYAVLAGKYWDCAFRITELPDVKVVDSSSNGTAVVFKKPTDPLQFEKLKQCVVKGLEFADMGLALDDKSESAWSYKTNLLLENAKVDEMEGMDLAKANHLKESNQAGARAIKLAEERRRRQETDSSEPPANARPSPPPRVPIKPMFLKS